MIQRGVQARRQQDDALALDLFLRAYAMHASPRAAAQVGLAEIALGRWVDAEQHLRLAIDARHDPWIQRNTKILEQSLRRVGEEVGMLEVLGSPPGSEVVIGAEVRGTLPLRKPIHVRAGEVRFEVRARRYVPETRAVRVLAGQLTRETVALVAEPSQAPPASSPSTPPARVATANTPSPSSGPPPEEANSDEPEELAHGGSGAGLRTGGIVLTAAGVGVVLTGVVFGVKARSAGMTDSRAATFVPGDETSGHRYEMLEWIGYGAGAALIAGGVTTYLLGASRQHADRPAIAIMPTPSGASASIGMTY